MKQCDCQLSNRLSHDWVCEAGLHPKPTTPVRKLPILVEDWSTVAVASLGSQIHWTLSNSKTKLKKHPLHNLLHKTITCHRVNFTTFHNGFVCSVMRDSYFMNLVSLDRGETRLSLDTYLFQKYITDFLKFYFKDGFTFFVDTLYSLSYDSVPISSPPSWIYPNKG